MKETAELLAEEQLHERQDLVRGLKDRHIQLIAIGGAIGVGLFLGSARAIQSAGPGLLLAYGLGAVIVFFLARALGELLLYRPVAGSFTTYAEEFIGPWAGFFTGWSYWLMWVVAGIAEITAVGLYVQYWFPDVPQWVPALITLAVLYGMNLIAVGLFGELEFWFALIKVITIIALIVLGVVIIVFGIGDLGRQASFANLWSNGGFLPMGVSGVILALPIALFSFGGVELIGVTAGEAQDPERTLPKAINAVVYRILIFYIGALLVIMSLVAWNQLDPKQSPFVMVFERIGIPAAAGIINFVVLTAAASACNSGIFSTGRMLYTLAQFGQAPKAFAKVSSRHVPAAGVTISACIMLVGVLLNYLVPEKVFIYASSVVVVAMLWTWAMIVHLRYRTRRGACARARSACRAGLTRTGSCSPPSSWSWRCWVPTRTAGSRSTRRRSGLGSWPSATEWSRRVRTRRCGRSRSRVGPPRARGG